MIFMIKKACVGGMTSGRLFATEFEWLIFGSKHLNRKSVILILFRKTARSHVTPPPQAFRYKNESTSYHFSIILY